MNKNEFKIRGEVLFIANDEVYGRVDQHKKRVVTIGVPCDDLVQEIAVAFIDDDILMVEKVKKFDIVDVVFKLRGNSFIGTVGVKKGVRSWYVNLRGIKISKI